jgi:negative regulator of sigma E activity
MRYVAIQSDQNSEAIDLQEILKRLSAHDEWQNRHLIEYQVNRKFHAANPRFKTEAVLEVKTLFRQPGKFESQVLRSEGSDLIRERVFDRILEAESEANSTETKQEVSITPANYNFVMLGKQECDGRDCYNLRITPKKKNKYSILGQIWVDATDGAIVRIQGSPAKRPSFWTLSTQIERNYKRISGVWLCDSMESTSNIFIAGQSTLKIDYDYVSVKTETSQLQ